MLAFVIGIESWSRVLNIIGSLMLILGLVFIWLYSFSVISVTNPLSYLFVLLSFFSVLSFSEKLCSFGICFSSMITFTVFSPS